MKQEHDKPVSATDVDRYLRGDMTPEDQYALERAALLDPLLADAIEGFSQTQTTNWQPHLKRLEERIQSHQNETKKNAPVVSIGFWKNTRQLAAALLAITALGAGLWALFQPEETTTIAKQVTAPTKEVLDTIGLNTPSSTPTTTPNQAEPNPVHSTKNNTVKTDQITHSQVPPPVIADVSSAPYRPAKDQPVSTDMLKESSAVPPAPATQAEEELAERNIAMNEAPLQEMVISNAAPTNTRPEAYQRKRELDQRAAISEQTMRNAAKSSNANAVSKSVEVEKSKQLQLISHSEGLEPVNDGWLRVQESIQKAFRNNPSCTTSPVKVVHIHFQVGSDGKWKSVEWSSPELPAACQQLFSDVLNTVNWKSTNSTTSHFMIWAW